jgi:hypothetical protein
MERKQDEAEQAGDMKDFEAHMTRVVEAVIMFFQWTPNWLLTIVGFLCWASAVHTMFTHNDAIVPWQGFVFGMGAALVGTACGMALMIKTR